MYNDRAFASVSMCWEDACWALRQGCGLGRVGQWRDAVRDIGVGRHWAVVCQYAVYRLARSLNVKGTVHIDKCE